MRRACSPSSERRTDDDLRARPSFLAFRRPRVGAPAGRTPDQASRRSHAAGVLLDHLSSGAIRNCGTEEEENHCQRQTRIPLYQRALGFGFPGVRVDGNDVLATYAVTQAALQRARDGQGPTFVEAYTYRMGAHTTTDDPTRYRLSDDVERWRLKCPIERIKAYLRRNGLADQTSSTSSPPRPTSSAPACARACGSCADPSPLSVFDHVYAEMTPELEEQRDGYAAYLDSFEGSH